MVSPHHLAVIVGRAKAWLCQYGGEREYSKGRSDDWFAPNKNNSC